MNPETLTQIRKDAGLTQSEAAHLVWITPRAWQAYEYGERRISKPVLDLFLRKINHPDREQLLEDYS